MFQDLSKILNLQSLVLQVTNIHLQGEGNKYLVHPQQAIIVS